MSPQALQLLLPLLIIIPVIALRWRKLSRKQPLKLSRLWIRPAILLLVAAAALFAPQFISPPGMPVHHFVPLDAVALLLAIAVGAVGGWHLGRTMAIDVHPEDGTLMVQASPLGLIVLLGLVLARMGVRTIARTEAAAWHLDTVFVIDVLIVFSAALFVTRALEMYLRAKKVMEQAKTLP